VGEIYAAGEKGRRTKIKEAGKQSVVKWRKQFLPECLRLYTNLHYRVRYGNP